MLFLIMFFLGRLFLNDKYYVQTPGVSPRGLPVLFESTKHTPGQKKRKVRRAKRVGTPTRGRAASGTGLRSACPGR